MTQKSVAVLPFTDMSEKHDQEYFSDGLSEELIDVLTKIPDLRVPARTSSFSFRGKAATIGEIARELGVTHVLEGSVRKAGDRMRITAQLVRADNGFHVWSQTYDREVRDVFAVQDDIAHAVAEQLKSALLMPAEATKQTGSVEAHNLYLKARYLGHQRYACRSYAGSGSLRAGSAAGPQLRPGLGMAGLCAHQKDCPGQ